MQNTLKDPQVMHLYFYTLSTLNIYKYYLQLRYRSSGVKGMNHSYRCILFRTIPLHRIKNEIKGLFSGNTTQVYDR